MKLLKSLNGDIIYHTSHNSYKGVTNRFHEFAITNIRLGTRAIAERNINAIRSQIARASHRWA